MRTVRRRFRRTPLLPPEIQLYIIRLLIADFHWNGEDYYFWEAARRTLTCCALVCKLWHHECKDKIYSWLLVDSRQDLNWLSSWSSTNRSQLRQLCIVDNVNNRDHNVHKIYVTENALRASDWLATLLLRRLQEFAKSIKSIDWRHNDRQCKVVVPFWHMATPRLLPAAFHRCTALTRLVLWSHNFPRFSHLAQLLASFERLEEAELRDIFWGDDPSSVCVRAKGNPNLRTVVHDHPTKYSPSTLWFLLISPCSSICKSPPFLLNLHEAKCIVRLSEPVIGACAATGEVAKKPRKRSDQPARVVVSEWMMPEIVVRTEDYHKDSNKQDAQPGNRRIPYGYVLRLEQRERGMCMFLSMTLRKALRWLKELYHRDHRSANQAAHSTAHARIQYTGSSVAAFIDWPYSVLRL